MLSTVAIFSLALAVPAAAQQSGSSNQPAAAQQSGSSQSSAAQQSSQEQNLTKEEIRQAQQALDQKGFKAGQADGVLGPETKNAIKEFQQKQGLNATGELDGQTMSALGVSPNAQSGQAGGQRPSTTGEQTPAGGGRNAP
jgi:peptidoglycan hydrolase-like protein with peptidoglycan-binding domain